MNQEKIKKIAVFALVLALLTLSQSGAISSVINYNLITDNNHSNLSHLDYTSSNHTGFESSSHASSTYLSQTNALLLYEQKIPFQIHSHKPPFGIPYEDGGQIDYYNLKNISLLPYDILLSNYTNNYNWVNNSTMASDNTKLNISGGNLNGSLKIYLPSNVTYSNLSLCGSGLGINCDEFSIESYNKNDSIMNFMTIRAISSSTTKYAYLFMSRIYADWDGQNITNMRYLTDQSTLGLISFQASMNETKKLSGTKAKIQVKADGDWTNSYWGTKMELWTSSGKGIIINQSGNIQLNAVEYSSAGNRAACFDSTGKLYASTNSTSNYLTC